MNIRTSQMSDRQFEKFVQTHPVSGGDRASQKAAGEANQQAASVAGQAGANAQNAQSALTPFYRSEMQAQHAYTPGQLNTLLTSAEAPAAASTATAAGQAREQAARTRNASGFSAGLDQAARDRAAAVGQAGLGIAGEDIRGAQALRQAGAEGMSGLFKTDTQAQLEAMGQQARDIEAETQAGQSGWYQNLLGGLNTAANVYKAFKPGQNNG